MIVGKAYRWTAQKRRKEKEKKKGGMEMTEVTESYGARKTGWEGVRDAEVPG